MNGFSPLADARTHRDAEGPIVVLSKLMEGWNYEAHPYWSRTFIRSAKRKWRKVCGETCSCGSVMAFGAGNSRHPRAATIDHILARGRGGADHPTNMTVLCWTCNQAKSKREAAIIREMRTPVHVRLGWSAEATIAASTGPDGCSSLAGYAVAKRRSEP